MKSYKAKGIISKVKRQHIKWRKYLSIISDERLISKICRNSYNSIVKIHEPSFKMGKELEEPSLLNKHNISQQVYKKVLNITTHEGKVNQNHSDIYPYTCWAGYYKKERECWQECEEMETLVY